MRIFGFNSGCYPGTRRLGIIEDKRLAQFGRFSLVNVELNRGFVIGITGFDIRQDGYQGVNKGILLRQRKFEGFQRLDQRVNMLGCFKAAGKLPPAEPQVA